MTGSPTVPTLPREAVGRLSLAALACLVLSACGDAKYPDYDDLDLAPYYADLRSSFQQAPSSRVLPRGLDGTPTIAPRPPVQVRPLPAAPNAPTPLVPKGGAS